MNSDIFLNQLSSLIQEYESFRQSARHQDLSDLPKSDRQSLITKSIAAIHRISGTTSTYSVEVNRILVQMPEIHLHTSSIMGIVQALRTDIEAGYIQTLAELIHAELFADFLEMAQHLCETGYKDAAAVIIGSTLENHIRKLCDKNRVPTENPDKDGNLRPARSDALNVELAKAKVYSKLEQKNVTAWLGIRNNAAHGQYDQYNAEQVTLFLAEVRSFITRNPA